MKQLTLIITLLFTTASVFAGKALDNQQLKTKLGSVLTQKINKIENSPIPGIKEVYIGTDIIYASEDGHYVFQGEIFKIGKGRGVVNLTDKKKSGLRVAALGKIGDEKMIIFGDEKAKHTISVFTDIDCGYCAKFHREIKDYTDKDMRIRYLFFPRTGLKTASYDKAVTTWCSKDRHDAITRSKAGEKLPNKTCKNPINEHYALGVRLGVTGTPTMILENGEVIPGYVPAKQLKGALDSLVN